MAPQKTPGSRSSENETLAEQFYGQVTESIKLVFDLTSRIDERVKMLVERQNDTEERLEKIIETQQMILGRVAILEAKDLSSVGKEVGDLNKRMTVLETMDPTTTKDIEALQQKVQVLELKTETLLLRTQTQENRWMRVFEFVFKIGVMMVAAYLLWKLGWQAPP